MTKHVLAIALFASILGIMGCNPTLKEFPVPSCKFKIGAYSKPINQIIPLPRQVGRGLVVDNYVTQVDGNEYIFGCIRKKNGGQLPKRAKDFPWARYMKATYGEDNVTLKSIEHLGAKATQVSLSSLYKYRFLVINGISIPSRERIIFAYSVYERKEGHKHQRISRKFLLSIKPDSNKKP